MVKTKDNWSALSMKDRAELINIYVKGGMMDLKEIKRHYNSLSDGEPRTAREYMIDKARYDMGARDIHAVSSMIPDRSDYNGSTLVELTNNTNVENNNGDSKIHFISRGKHSYDDGLYNTTYVENINNNEDVHSKIHYSFGLNNGDRYHTYNNDGELSDYYERDYARDLGMKYLHQAQPFKTQEPNKYEDGGDSGGGLGSLLGKAGSMLGSSGGSGGGGIGGAMGIAGSAMTMVENFKKNAEVNTTEADNAVEAVRSFEPDGSSLDALTESYNAAPWADTDVDFESFLPSTGEYISNTLSSTMSGISAGASVGGPWGAVIGGVVGLGSAVGGIFAGREKAKLEEKRLEKEAKQANTAVENKAINSRDAIMQQQKNNILRNIAADGGRLLKGDEKEQTLSGKSFWQKLLESGQSGRDARVGAVGAQQVRDLYNEGKTEEASELAKKYAKANTTGIALAGGAASPSLLGDLIVTGATTTADTLLEGDIDSLNKDLAINSALDIAGRIITNKAGTILPKTKEFAKKQLTNFAKNPNIKFLDKKVPMFETLLNWSLPKSERDRIFRNAHLYNEAQKKAIGLPQNIIPLESDIVYTVPTIREQLLNTLNLTPSVTGNAKAQALHSGKEVKYFLEGFRPFSRKNKPRHIAAHEVKHDIQDTFVGSTLPKKTYGEFELEPTSQMALPDYGHKFSNDSLENLSNDEFIIYNILKKETNPKLKEVAKKLYDNSTLTNWHKSLNEFDAELAFYRELYNENLPYSKLSEKTRNSIRKDMANRFGISEELVDEIASVLEINGYANGGKLKFNDGGDKKDIANLNSAFLYQPETETVEEPVVENTYTVKQGDSLSKIANNFNLPLELLKKENPMDDYNRISIGQSLKIPQYEKSEQPVVTEDFDVYNVKQGDTLSKIAKDNNISVSKLLQINPQIKNENVINVGQSINLRKEQKPVEVQKKWVNVEELREQEKEFNKSNLGAIQGYKHDSNYIVVDKKGKKLTVYNANNEKVYETSDISTGLSGDDYNTVTYTKKVNGKDVIDHGKGNMSTPAGITKISSITDYHGAPAFQRARLNGEENIRKVKDSETGELIDDNVASSFHSGRTAAIYSSNGCVRMSNKALRELSNYVDVGTTCYTLPDKEGSRFVLKDGNLNFEADNPFGLTEKNVKFNAYGKDIESHDDYNVHIDRRSTPIKIEYDGWDGILGVRGNNIDKLIDGIVSNKAALQKAFKISDQHYNKIAHIALGVIGQESKYGTHRKYIGKKLLSSYDIGLLDEKNPQKTGITGLDVAKYVMGNNTYDSLGMGQIKMEGDNEETQRYYKMFGVTPENVYSDEKTAEAIMIRLLSMYNNEVRGRKFKDKETEHEVDSYDALLYFYKGGDMARVLRSGEAIVGRNTYVNAVKDYMKNFKIYTYK